MNVTNESGVTAPVVKFTMCLTTGGGCMFLKDGIIGVSKDFDQSVWERMKVEHFPSTFPDLSSAVKVEETDCESKL